MIAWFSGRRSVASRTARRNQRRGVATVEAALLLPVFALVVCATIEICSMIFLQQSLEIAAYEGARTAIVPKSTAAHAEFAATTLLTGRNVNGGVATVNPSNIPAQPYGTVIRVTVTAPCDPNSLFPAWFFAGQTLTAHVDMMKEQ